METSQRDRDIARDAAFGGLFQQIINEMKNSSPLWEDLTTKSTKLHSCLRATIQAVSAFLDAFQKIADAATSTNGATKDIGTSLTRICMRHKALESKLKTFTSSILDCLIIPLQERLEEWKKTTVHLDKEHAKEYKRSRAELKKRSIETLRLQKKVRKVLNNGGMSGSFSGTMPRSAGGNVTGIGSMSSSVGGDTLGPLHHGGAGNRDLNKVLEVALRDTADKRQQFEETEKQAIRAALIEERSRFCTFVSFLKPVVDEEVSMLSELSHVHEAMQQLEKHSTDPFALPPASEQVITDLKGSSDSGTWSFTTPPSSPSSLGSRKSSMCSISSVNSSSSGSGQSPSHNLQNRTILHQPAPCYPVNTLRYTSVSSQDSGFISQEGLHYRRAKPVVDHRYFQPENQSHENSTSSAGSSNSSTPSSPYPPGAIPTTNATWPNLQDSIQFERAACAIMNERPHTISSAYDRSHQRPPLTVYTFKAPADSAGNSPPFSSTTTPVVTPVLDSHSQSQAEAVYQSTSEVYGTLRGKGEPKPPVPKRCSSLERPPQVTSAGSMGPPMVPNNSKSSKRSSKDQKRDSVSSLKPVPTLPDFNEASSDMIVPQPVYVNMHELNQMTAARMLRQQQAMERQQNELPPPPPELMNAAAKVDGNNSQSSSGYGSQNQIIITDDSMIASAYGTTGSGSGSGSNSNSSTLTAKTSVGETEDLNRSSFNSSLMCSCLDLTTTSGYCTLPRSHNKDCPFARSRVLTRPPVYGYLGGRQRNSCASQDKPLPPVRRTSSISVSPSPSRSPSISAAAPVQQNYQSQQNYQNPEQLQTRSYNNNFQGASNSTKDQGIYSQHHQQEAYNNSGNLQAAGEHLPPPPSHLMTGASDDKQCQGQGQHMSPDELAMKRMSVADTIRTLTDKNHQPVSPNMVRRAHSMKAPGEEKPQVAHTNSNPVKNTANNWNSGKLQSVNNSINSNNHSSHNNSNNQRDASKGPSIIQVLSQKLTQQLPQPPAPTNQPLYGHLGNSQSHGQPVYVPEHQQHTQPTYGHLGHQQQHQNQPTYVQTTGQNQPTYVQSGQNHTEPFYAQQYQHPQQPVHIQPIYQQIVHVKSTNNSQSEQNSPRNARRLSEELLRTTATFVQNRVLGNKTPPPVVTSKEIFVQTLNAKLSKMRVASPPTERRMSNPSLTTKTSFASKLVASVSAGGQHHYHKGNSVGEMSTAHRVRQWISSKTIPDPTIVRESLMDQIRRGTKLKQTRAVSDRSAPQIR